jgi:hypothetical protein
LRGTALESEGMRMWWLWLKGQWADGPIISSWGIQPDGDKISPTTAGNRPPLA